MIPSTQRFSNRVEYYVRARPGYPTALLRFFQSELGLSPAHLVADIGSGTGFLTELFVRNGNLTYAVEPNGPMRKAAEHYLHEWSNFHSIDGTAEATTLADAGVDFVTAGQAFHWFDAEKSATQFRRILRPGGFVALVWNQRLIQGSPFMQAFDTLIEQFKKPGEPARLRLNDEREDPSILTFFSAGGYQVRKFDNPQTLDRDGLIDRVVSSSNMPSPGEARHDELLESLGSLFDAHQQNQSVTFLQETRVYYGQL